MMKPIKICQENTAAIEEALKAANGKARAHTFTCYLEIENVADQAERDLMSFGVTKANRSGASYFVTSGGYLPNAYDNKAIQTVVRLKRRSSGWYLVDVFTVSLWPRQNPRRELTVTQAQADEACKRLLATVTVKRAADEQVAA